MSRIVRAVPLVAALLLSAGALVDGWSISSPGSIAVYADSELVLTTNDPEFGTSSPALYAYRTTDQQRIWTQSAPCPNSDYLAMWPHTFRQTAPGVLTYLCSYTDYGSNSGDSVHRLDVSTGNLVLSVAAVSAIDWTGTVQANTASGAFCVPLSPPKCVLLNGTVATFPAASVWEDETGAHLYIYTTTLVAVANDRVYRMDLVTGNVDGVLTHYSGETDSDLRTAAVDFVGAYVVLTRVIQIQEGERVEVVVVDIAGMRITQAVRLAGVGEAVSESVVFEQPPMVAALPQNDTRSSSAPLELVVGLMTTSPSSADGNRLFTLSTWRLVAVDPTFNTTASTGSKATWVPQVRKWYTTQLQRPNTGTYAPIKAGCAVAGAFVACSAWGTETGYPEVEPATFALLDVWTGSMRNSTYGGDAVFDLRTVGTTGGMVIVGGSQGGAVPTTGTGYYNGAAAYDARTGAWLWHLYGSVVGPAIAYDSNNTCVVMATSTQVLCVGFNGGY